MRSFLIVILLILSTEIISQDSSWFSQNPLPQNNIYSIKFFDLNNGIGFSDKGIILKTSNQGYSWQFLQSPTTKNLYASQFINNSTGYTAGDSGIVMKTINGGNNWSVMNTGALSSLNTIYFFDVNTGFAAGDSGKIIKTTNAGLNWQQSIITTKKLNSVFFTTTLNGFAVGDTTFLFKTTNGGINWTTQYISLQYKRAVYFVDAMIGFIRTETEILRTSDGGINWQSTGNLGMNVKYAAIDFVNSSTGYMVSDNSREYITTNAGLNWGIGSPTPSNVFPQFKIYSIDALDTGNIFISGNNGSIFKSRHSSDIWTHIGGNKNNYYYVSFINSMTGYIHSGNYILNTTNGGEKWFINSYGGNNWFEPWWLDYKKIVSKNNGLTIRHQRSGGGGGPNTAEYAYISTDGGLTWPIVTGGQFVYVNDVALADDFGAAIFVSSNYSVRKSTTGGSWVILYTSPNTSPLYKISFHNNNTGVIIGRNNTINEYFLLRTSNGGQNWNTQIPVVKRNLSEIQLLPTGTGIILCDSTQLLHTANYSSTWSIRYNGPVRFRTVTMLDDYNGYGLSTGNMFIHTSNGGLNWSEHDAGTNRRLNSVTFTDLNTGYIIGDSGTILKTTNGGLTFLNNNAGFLPKYYSFSQNYPNPFNPVTNIKFEIPLSRGVSEGRGVFVKLIVFDLLGREITTLVNQQMKPGSYNVDWDASNYPSGVYFYKLESSDFIESKKMVLVK